MIRWLLAAALIALVPPFNTAEVLSESKGQSDKGIVVTAQILDYERGFVFFTSGDGFRVSPTVQISPAGEQPRVRQYARVTFDPSGLVTKIELAKKPFPPQGDVNALSQFAVSLSTPYPNPELNPNQPIGGCGRVVAGKRVTVTFNIEVPPTTRPGDLVYMTTDQSGWNAQAYRLDRVDALHYRTTLRLLSGTVLHYLFDRGSAVSVQRAENGLEQQPYTLCISDADAQAIGKTVYAWGDETPTGNLPIPQTVPTPYNPAPFPNLPTPAPVRTPLAN